MGQEHAGHRQRMRERFRQQGLQGFAPHEVLELILFYAIPQRKVNPLAHRLLDQFGSLHAVLDASVEQLMQVEGVGEYAATLLHLFSDVGRQLGVSRSSQESVPFDIGHAKKHCLNLLDGLTEEHFYVVCLDSRMCLIRDVLIAKGSIDEVPTYPRIVAQAVLACNAYAVVLCHNHPGGDIVPSQPDLDATSTLHNMLKTMNVRLVDHMVVAGGRVVSMVNLGLIVHENPQNVLETQVADSAGGVMIRHRVRKQLEKELE